MLGRNLVARTRKVLLRLPIAPWVITSWNLEESECCFLSLCYTSLPTTLDCSFRSTLQSRSSYLTISKKVNEPISHLKRLTILSKCEKVVKFCRCARSHERCNCWRVRDTASWAKESSSSSAHSHPHRHALPLLHPSLLSLPLPQCSFNPKVLLQHSKASQMLKNKTKEL